MSFNFPTEFNLTEILTNGVYYNPAWKHYGRIADVYCDKCEKKINCCIGYGERDLCLKCASEVDEKQNGDEKQIQEEILNIQRSLNGYTINWNRGNEIMQEIKEGAKVIVDILTPSNFPGIPSIPDCWGHQSAQRRKDADSYRRDLVDRIVKKYQTESIFIGRTHCFPDPTKKRLVTDPNQDYYWNLLADGCQK